MILQTELCWNRCHFAVGSCRNSFYRLFSELSKSAGVFEGIRKKEKQFQIHPFRSIQRNVKCDGVTTMQKTLRSSRLLVMSSYCAAVILLEQIPSYSAFSFSLRTLYSVSHLPSFYNCHTSTQRWKCGCKQHLNLCRYTHTHQYISTHPTGGPLWVEAGDSNTEKIRFTEKRENISANSHNNSKTESANIEKNHEFTPTIHLQTYFCALHQCPSPFCSKAHRFALLLLSINMHQLLYKYLT